MYQTACENPELYEKIGWKENGLYKMRPVAYEAGSFNGLSQSNTLKLDRNGWKCFLVEPNPLMAAQCVFNRPDCVTENCALVAPDYPHEYIYGNFMSNSLISSVAEPPFYLDDTVRGEYNQRAKGDQIAVRARTLQYLFDKHQTTYINFLSLDVEGYELEALMGINFKKVSIQYALIETANKPHYEQLITQFMERKGFEVYSKTIHGNDTLFRNPNFTYTIAGNNE